MGSGLLSICPSKGSADFPNGVSYLTTYFDHTMRLQGFASQHRWPEKTHTPSGLRQDPVVQRWMKKDKRRQKSPGAIDFFKNLEGLRVGVEWETGYIGSSHRAVSKLFNAIVDGMIDAGVLVIPERALQKHCTDRSSNYEELECYTDLMDLILMFLKHGYLEIIVVGYDELDASLPYLKQTDIGTLLKSDRRMAPSS